MTDTPNNRYPVTAARRLVAYALEGLNAMDEGAELNVYNAVDLMAQAIAANPDFAIGRKHYLFELQDVQAGKYCEEDKEGE